MSSIHNHKLSIYPLSKSEFLSINNNGNGVANLIYVDNLIDAILLAMQKDAAIGEAFIVVDDDGLTWGQVYKAYAGLLDAHPPMRSMSIEEIEDMKKEMLQMILEVGLLNPLFNT